MTHDDGQLPSPEFSHVIDISKVPKTGLNIKLEVDEKSRKRLAERYGIAAISMLSVFLQVKPWRRDGLQVAGTLKADVEQKCIVSLEPVFDQIAEDISVFFLPPGQDADFDQLDVTVDPNSADDFDMLEDSEIDLGELVAEQLSVAIDPYPRKPGVDLKAVLPNFTDIADKKPRNPFEVLKSMDIAKEPHDTN